MMCACSMPRPYGAKLIEIVQSARNRLNSTAFILVLPIGASSVGMIFIRALRLPLRSNPQFAAAVALVDHGICALWLALTLIELARDNDSHLDGGWANWNRGGRDGAVLGEGVGRESRGAVLLRTGHILRPVRMRELLGNRHRQCAAPRKLRLVAQLSLDP